MRSRRAKHAGKASGCMLGAVSLHYVSPDSLRRAKRIKLVVFDVDGTLTNGLRYYGPEGEELKAFHSFDGMALNLLHSVGLDTGIMTTGNVPSVRARAKEMHIRYVMEGVKDKAKAFSSLLRRTRLAAQSIAYMGDDLVDLPVLRRCGFASAPIDAPEEIRRVTHFISANPAGCGAAREVAEFILLAQDKLERAMKKQGR
jgi:3-deoxy-D-manno-octulosonate 8-phosphate phosphatase (KDO 8-P phosphatase)